MLGKGIVDPLSLCNHIVRMIFPLFFLLSKYCWASVACASGKVLSTIGLKVPSANRGVANRAYSWTRSTLNCFGLARSVLPIIVSLLLMIYTKHKLVTLAMSLMPNSAGPEEIVNLTVILPLADVQIH